MGYIQLNCPVTHLWYLKGIPNYLCILLKCFDKKLKVSDLEKIVYFKEGERIIDSENPLYKFFQNQIREDNNELKPFLINQYQKKNFKDKKLKSITEKNFFSKRLGAEILQAALEAINLSKEIKHARSLIERLSFRNLNLSFIPDRALVRRIRILESFLATKINPSWMILQTLPVLPPNLRPLLELDGGRLVAADVNEIYRLIITRNQRLHDFIYQFIAPDLITIHARKLLQEGVDSLIDNARLPKEKTFCLNNKALKSLTEILEGKQGRFRHSLLGKRVDYSGRSVIIVGPNLRLNQCGLPYEMGIELFQPFLINELLKTKIKAPSHNTKLAYLIIKKNKPFIWTLLTALTQKYSILLNRAPTLHRFGIQAFDPVLVLGQAIHLHPLVCTGFNADFDGDQMAVHLPLYETSQLEVRTLMRPCYNVLSPSNGEVILKPTQDMVIGCYYLTLMIKKYSSLIEKWFPNENEALMAFYQKKISLHLPILVRYNLLNFEIKSENKKLKLIDTLSYFKLSEKELVILKIFTLPKKNSLNYFLITNIGIIILKEDLKGSFSFSDLYLETTVGRLIFSLNIKNVLKKEKKE
jgi:DNA-directed RNA polymerase subunit beta'